MTFQIIASEQNEDNTESPNRSGGSVEFAARIALQLACMEDGGCRPQRQDVGRPTDRVSHCQPARLPRNLRARSDEAQALLHFLLTYSINAPPALYRSESNTLQYCCSLKRRFACVNAAWGTLCFHSFPASGPRYMLSSSI
jgi:hypothetical protein